VTTAARPSTARKPADRKPKATAGFEFTVAGKTYTLPHPSAALAKIPGRSFRDALLGGEEGEMKFGFVCLEAVDADPESIDAVYDLPADEMIALIGRWMGSIDKDGATLPQS